MDPSVPITSDELLRKRNKKRNAQLWRNTRFLTEQLWIRKIFLGKYFRTKNCK